MIRFMEVNANHLYGHSVSRLNAAYFAVHGSDERLNKAIIFLETKNEQLAKENADLKIKVDTLEAEVAQLKEKLGLAALDRFGKRTETSDSLLGEAIVEEDTSGQTQTVAGYTRKKGKKKNGRLIDTSVLPRYRMYHELLGDALNCPSCCKPMKTIGQDKSEQLELLPQILYVIEHIRKKHACTDCNTLHMPPKPQSPIPKGLAGSSLITEVILNKYQYHLPLYRQSQILASYGVNIPDNTLGNWIGQVGDTLLQLDDACWEIIIASNYLQVDETTYQLLSQDKKGYIWCYLAPNVGDGKSLMAYDANTSRSGEVVNDRLSEFKGLLQTDGYAGYNQLRERETITGFGCLTHMRRKFANVVKVSKNEEGIAAGLIEKLKPLYTLEAYAKQNNLSHHSRKRLRQKFGWPILKHIKAWLKSVKPDVPPKSKLGQAINYSLTQWPYLIRYLRHGQAEIDTNMVENKIRPIALGRRNWLFMANERSARVNAILFTLIQNCILNKINPRVYIHYLITQIPQLRKGQIEPKSLLPHLVPNQVLDEFAKSHIENSKKVLNKLIFDSS